MTDVTQAQLHPRVRYLDRNGLPLAGGKVYAYELGTTIDKTTYSDATGLVPNPQPIILDSAGQANIFGSGLYTLIILDHNYVPVDSIDGEAYYSEGSEVLGTLAGSTGAGLVGFMQKGTGAVLRTVQDKLRDVVSVEDFGAIGDGMLHPLSEQFSTLAGAQEKYPFVQALTQSLDWAAFQAAANTKCDLIVPQGVYVFNERLDLYSKLTGAGCDEWDQKGTWRPRKMDRGTTILMADTPLLGNSVTVVGVSNCDVGGGVLLNDNYALVPSDAMSGNQYYSLLDFTNADGVGVTMATPKPLKVGVRLFNGAALNNLRVQLNYNGVDGYNSVESLRDFPEYSTSYKGLGDEWDIGVLTYNSLNTRVNNCQIVGYWRMAARAVISANFGDGKSFSGAWFYDDGVFYQGFVGLSIRGNDTYRIQPDTSGNQIRVAWSASHQIPTNGTAYISGIAHTYTTLTRLGDTLILGGFIDDITILPKNPRLTLGVNPAFAGSSVANGFVTDLNHFSNLRSYDPAMDMPTVTPGHAHEISGNPLRNIDFTNIHFFANDCIGWLHSASQCSYIQCYAEATGYDSPTVALTTSKGARYIACPRPDSVDIRSPNSSGWCSTLSWDDSCQLGDGSIDMYPMHRSTSSSRRFIGTTKWFMPDVIRMDAVGYWTERNVGWTGYNIGTRQFSTGVNYQWGVSTPKFDYQFFIDGTAAVAADDPSLINVGIGTTSPSASLSVLRSSSPGLALIQTAESTLTDPFLQLGNKVFDGSNWMPHVWTILSQCGSINQLQLRYDNNIRFQINSATGTLFSGADNSADIGTSSNRFKTIFAATGTINTSDTRYKQQLHYQDSAEKAAALEIKTTIKKFKFNDAVDQKGYLARWHTGVLAQEVIDILRSHGLDPMSYAFVCYDEWEEELEVKGEDGEVLVPYRAAGNIYGIRYEELAMFILAAL